MNAAGGDVRFVYAGNILADEQAVRRIGGAEEVILLAEYYGTSTDYILGLTDDPAPRA